MLLFNVLDHQVQIISFIMHTTIKFILTVHPDVTGWMHLQYYEFVYLYNSSAIYIVLIHVHPLKGERAEAKGQDTHTHTHKHTHNHTTNTHTHAQSKKRLESLRARLTDWR